MNGLQVPQGARGLGNWPIRNREFGGRNLGWTFWCPPGTSIWTRNMTRHHDSPMPEVEGPGLDRGSTDSLWRELIQLALESERFASVEELPMDPDPDRVIERNGDPRCHHDACLDHSWLNVVRAYGRPCGPIMPDTP